MPQSVPNPGHEGKQHVNMLRGITTRSVSYISFSAGMGWKRMLWVPNECKTLMNVGEVIDI